MGDDGPPSTRRGLLAAGASVAASGLAGCSERLWWRAEDTGPDQVELTIAAAPPDDDLFASMIASQLRDNFTAAGIDATSEPVPETELYREVLLQGDYDVFVARHPGLDDPGALRGLLHSEYVGERGWQNPFHFSDPRIDDALEDQLEAEGEERTDVLGDLLTDVEPMPPYTVVAFPQRLGVASTDVSPDIPPQHPLEYVDVMSRAPSGGSRNGPLEVGVFGAALTDRLNPITVDQRRIDGLVGLLYDPLVRRIDDEYVPWLAEGVDWDEQGPLEATVTLRNGLSWHDGTTIDAEDVAFTYDFLADTSMGDSDSPIPAPRYRDRSSLPDSVTADGSRRVRFSFGSTGREAARRAFTVPLLPRHEWAEHATVVADYQTEALAVDNEEPVGSGLFALEDLTAEQELELAPFEDHVLRDAAADRPDALEGFSQFEGIRFQIEPNAGAVADALLEGDIDLTATAIPPETLAETRTENGVDAVVGSTDAFYMIGYNLHEQPLGTTGVRRILSRLIDREHAAEEFFDGYAEPATDYAGLVGLAEDRWDHPDPDAVDFPGTDGEVDATRARSLFEESLGYRYESDQLIR